MALLAIGGLTLVAHPHAQKEAVVTNHAKGTFEVKVIPQAADDPAGGPSAGCFSTSSSTVTWTPAAKARCSPPARRSKVRRLTSPWKSSAALGGRRGGFILQHAGTMRKGAPTLIVTVVPDSGTDQLTGLRAR